MRAPLWQRYWIMLQSILNTLWISCRGITWIMTGHYSKTRGDNTLRLWGQKLLRYSKTNYTFHNPNAIKLTKGRCHIVMSNHASLYDIPLLFAALPFSVRMIAKKELFRLPIWGRALHMSGFVSIDRNNRQQARKDLDYAKQLMQQGTVLWIAPEGGRTRDGHLRPFKQGGFSLALETDAIIIPCALHNTRNILPAKSQALHLYQQTDLVLGAPFDTRDYTMAQRSELKDEVFARIHDLLATKPS